MSIFDGLKNRVRNWLDLDDYSVSVTEYRDRVERMREYRKGKQAIQIKKRTNQPDDNLVVNFCGLIVDRSVSLLFGDGIEIDLGDNEETTDEEGNKVSETSNRQAYIDEVLDANKQEIFFHKIGVLGAESGDCYVKIQPDMLEDETLPRLIALDPELVDLESDPQDFEHILAYNIRYDLMENVGGQAKKVKYWERTQHKGATVFDEKGRVIKEGAVDENGQAVIDPTAWEVITFRKVATAWEVYGDIVDWPYSFPPICHWQNLPSPISCHGEADLSEDVITLQDAFNFVASNEKKIIRLHAHPKTIGTGFNAKDLDTAPDKMIILPSPEAKVYNVEMQSDLAETNAFMLMLRQALFDITRTVDISSMADKLGALTNFGLHVLYADALFKLGTKRELYGDGIQDLVSRLLQLKKMDPDPGNIVWPDMLPVNETEVMATLRQEMELGLVSKQTAAKERGRDLETEQALIDEEKNKAGGNEEEILARLIARGT